MKTFFFGESPSFSSLSGAGISTLLGETIKALEKNRPSPALPVLRARTWRLHRHLLETGRSNLPPDPVETAAVQRMAELAGQPLPRDNYYPAAAEWLHGIWQRLETLDPHLDKCDDLVTFLRAWQTVTLEQVAN